MAAAIGCDRQTTRACPSTPLRQLHSLEGTGSYACYLVGTQIGHFAGVRYRRSLFASRSTYASV